ncbi:MAG: ABC transporter substrate-binding protein [Candidatus Acidiferrales bacterium]
MTKYSDAEHGFFPHGMSRRDFCERVSRCGGLLVGGRELLNAFPAEPSALNMESELVFACDGGSTQRIFETEFFPEFYQRYGVKITYVPGQNADILAKLRIQRRSPSIDVVWLAGGNTYEAIDGGLLMELDRSLVPNYALVAPEAGQEKVAAPVGVSVCGVAYNTRVFAEKGFSRPSSWWDLWDAKYKGHVGLYSINVTATTAMLVKVAQILTGDYKNIDPAFRKFSELRPNMLDFFTSAGAWETEMQEGDFWIGENTSVRGMQLRKSNVGFTLPKEGVVGYQTWVGVVKNAPHPRAAHAWVNYLLSTEGQEKMLRRIGYIPVNPQAKVPEDLAYFFPSLKTVFIPDWRYLARQLPYFVERWNREVEE